MHQKLIEQLDAEIAKLQQARQMLTVDLEPAGNGHRAPRQRAPRKLTPEGRERIRQAVKRRWAAVRKASKAK